VPLIVRLAVLLPFGGLSAQEDPVTTTISCDGKVVSAIDITPLDAEYPSVPRGVRWLTRALGVPNVTTTREAIESFLLVEEGQLCTERQRAESERILRLQPFLSDATVRAVADGAGGVRIEVETTDELATVLQLRFHGLVPSTVRLGNGNVAGQGLYVAASVQRGFANRTGLSFDAVAYQVLGRPFTLAASVERAPLGESLAAEFGHPFLTGLQRSAWHVAYQDANRYTSFVRPDQDPLALEVSRRFWDVGGVRRLGANPQSTFLGVLVSGEDVRPARSVLIVSDSGLVEAPSGGLGGPVQAYHNVRLNAVVGTRALSFTTVYGFDALMGAQDVATGVQVGALVGHGLPPLGSVDDDLFLSTDIYAGLGSARSFAALQVSVEGRRARGSGHWDAVVGSGRLAWYVKPADAHVLVGSVEAGGGWRGRVPFQLRLGDRQGGVRGYGSSPLAGAVRSVVRLEDRWGLGSLTGRDALAFAGFIDVGRVWAGDAPFGSDSGIRVGLGVGLLAALPPRSQRLWRLDLAIPVGSAPGARWEIRLSSLWTGAFWHEPDDVARVRAGASPATIFTW
jgi:hypothetical protein